MLTISDNPMSKLRSKYNILMRKVADQNRYMSFVNTKEFKELSSMGKPIIPFLVEELENNSNLWESLAILRMMHIDDGPIIPEEHKGKINEIKNIWLDFLTEH